MRITTTTLEDLIEKTNETLEEILLTQSQLRENLLDKTQSEDSKGKIEKLKKEIDQEREKLRSQKAAQKRKRDLEKLRTDQETKRQTEAKQGEAEDHSRTIPITDGRGHVVGYLRPIGKHSLLVLDSKGRVVAREIDGRTYDQNGVFQGRGQQGLRVLGMSMGK